MPPEQVESLGPQLRHRVYGLERLAVMPAVAQRLLQAMQDENVDAGQLEEIISSDQALTSKVLSLANSAYYAPVQEVTTIRRAVVGIGMQELSLLALGAGLAEPLSPDRLPPGWDPHLFWFHSLGVSFASRELARKAREIKPEEAMAGGLMHDLGKLVMLMVMPREYARILEESRAIPYQQAEKNWGLSHTLAGYWLAERWELPMVHQMVIRDHHQPRPSEPDYPAVCLVHLANLMVKRMGMGMAHQSDSLSPAPLMEATGLNPEVIVAVGRQLRESLPPLLDSWRQAMA